RLTLPLWAVAGDALRIIVCVPALRRATTVRAAAGAEIVIVCAPAVRLIVAWSVAVGALTAMVWTPASGRLVPATRVAVD
ncbi:MAG: hypothetical protein V4567_12750, partial [Pseudomonadota bacterium]